MKLYVEDLVKAMSQAESARARLRDAAKHAVAADSVAERKWYSVKDTESEKFITGQTLNGVKCALSALKESAALDARTKSRRVEAYTKVVRTWEAWEAATCAVHTKEADIEAALSAVQGKCHTRIVSVGDVVGAYNSVMRYFRTLPKKALKGLDVHVNPNAQAFPNAYYNAGTPMATTFTLRFTATGRGYVAEIARESCGRSQYTVSMTEETEREYLSRTLSAASHME